VLQQVGDECVPAPVQRGVEGGDAGALLGPQVGWRAGAGLRGGARDEGEQGLRAAASIADCEGFRERGEGSKGLRRRV